MGGSEGGSLPSDAAVPLNNILAVTKRNRSKNRNLLPRYAIKFPSAGNIFLTAGEKSPKNSRLLSRTRDRPTLARLSNFRFPFES